LGRLPLAERKSKGLLSAINAAQRRCRPGTLPDWFDLQARATPDSPAVECGGRTWSYRDLRERAEQLTAALRRAGAGRGCLVGLLVERSFDMVTGLIAILQSGAAYLPLDPQLPQARLDMRVADAKPLILLTQKSLLDRIAYAQAKIVLCEDASPSADRFDSMDLRGDPDDLAYVLYTSGSTGRPKAVEVRHRSLANLLTAMQDHLHLGTQDVLLAVTTPSFDIAALELFLPLVTGGCVSVASREEAMEPGRLVELLQRSRATVMQATPTTWRGLIAAGWSGSPKLKILCGGEALQSHLAHQLADRGEAVWNLYGPTETTIWSLIHKVRREDNPVPIGKPLANTEVYVLDTGGEPVPTGIAGELYIGGVGVARGYRNDPGLTEQKFCMLPALSSNSLYRTGDMVRFREDGLLEFLGRVDNQVKVRGFRVGLEEIEAAICAHPGIAASAVRAFGDASGESALAAFVVPKTPFAQDTNLRTFLGQTLPGYMVPTRFVFVSSLPTTANGKLDRAKLPVPQESGVRHVSEPRDELERMLARLWIRLLGISVPDVHDNFFDLGGHSLLAAMLMAEIKKETGRELPLATLFRAPTIASLADLLRTHEEADFSHLVALKSEGSGQPLFIVHGIFGNVLQLHGLAANMETDRPIYALQARGADLRQQPHATIAEMASAYIGAIRAVQPAGAYALAGYSFGGLIAFEMARRLREAGEEIDLLALFETDVSHRNLHSAEWLSSQWMIVRRNLRRLLALPPRQWMHFFMSRAAVLWRRLVWGRDFMRELDDASQNLPGSVRARNREMYDIGAREFAAYPPQYYPGTIAIFRTTDPGDPLPFWRKVADRVDVFDIAGEHGTIMDEPNVTRLAAQLSRCLAGHDFDSTNPLRSEQCLPDGAMVAPPFGKLGEPAI
jgi:amino acid adenylation domain-containing protein